MNNYHISLFVCILIAICGSSGMVHKSLRTVPENLETCKSQLGKAKDTIAIVKRFFKQVEKSISGFTDPSTLITKTEKERLDSEMEQLKSIIKQMKEQQNGTLKQHGGATFTRWGKNTCTGNSIETVYIGQVGGGSFNHGGSSVNYICLPNDPDHAHHLSNGAFDYLYGAEYEIFKNNKPYRMKSRLGDNDIPCAVCRTYKRSSALMIPGRKRCYKDWTKEYDGYLMAGQYNHAKGSEYICVDRNAGSVHGGSPNQNGALVFPVKVSCGSLKCPPYTAGTDVPCVVCTK